MKKGKFIVLGILALVLGMAKSAYAQPVFDLPVFDNPGLKDRGDGSTPTQEKIQEICDKLRETHEEVGGPKCDIVRKSCEEIIATGVEDQAIRECIVQDPDCFQQIGDTPRVCRRGRASQECVDKVLEEKIEEYVEQLEKECPPKKDPPADPKDPECPPAQPETPELDTAGNQDTGAGQVAPRPLLQLSGGGCTLGVNGGSYGLWNGLWMLLPMLALSKRK